MAKKSAAFQPIDALAIRDQIIEYLKKHSERRQEIIADLVGMRRESIWAYIQGRGLTDIADIQKLHDWMVQDKRNKRRLTRKQVSWLLSNAEAQLRESNHSQSPGAVEKWERKLRKYRKIEATTGSK